MYDDFLGFFELGDNLQVVIPIRNQNGTPIDPTTVPNVRIYDGLSLLTVTNLAKTDTGSITGASNATPIVITSANHGLETGNRIVVSNVGGNTAANGNFTITKIGSNNFSLDGGVGNGNYTSGGDWHVAGLYAINQPLTSPDFDAGKAYRALITYVEPAGNLTLSQSHTFAVT